MKKILFVLLLVVNTVQSQIRIKFRYDSAGNQTERYICISGCAEKMAKDSIFKTKKTLVEGDLIQDEEYEQIKYYPNPVLEELYVKWQNTNENNITQIQLYSLNGQLIKQFDDLKDKEVYTILFYNYPEGYYNLVLIYNNGERKTLKIVKNNR